MAPTGVMAKNMTKTKMKQCQHGEWLDNNARNKAVAQRVAGVTHHHFDGQVIIILTTGSSSME